MKTYIEKSGSFTNFKGLVQEFKMGTTLVEEALNLSEVVTLFKGHELDYKNRPQPLGGTKKNHFTEIRGQLCAIRSNGKSIKKVGTSLEF
jgi:hypothetical protein